MTASDLKQAISIAGGYDKVAGIMFDNSAKVIFDEDHLFKEDMIQDELIVFHYDVYPRRSIDGIIYGTVVPIDTVQGIVFVKDKSDIGKIGARDIL